MSTHQYFAIIWKVLLVFAVHPLPKPSSLTPSRPIQVYLFVWRCFLIIILCLLAFYTFLERETVLYSKDFIGHVNDILKYCSTVLTSLVVMVETYAKRSSHIALWRLAARVHQCGQTDDLEHQLDKAFAVKFWVCFSIFVGVEIRVSTGTLAINDAQWFQMWAVNVLPLMVCHLMSMLHIYYIDLLAAYFQHLQRELDGLVKYSEYSMYVKLDRTVIGRRLDTLKDLYGMLYEASEHVNTIFAWSQAFNISQVFLQSTCDLHWFYKEFEHDFPILVFNFFPSYSCLLLLLRAANSCLQAVNSLTPLVYQIRCTDEEAVLARMLHSFTAQLSHEVVSFGGNSLYTINYGLLRAMITGIVTYMIIFIQMTPEKSNN